MKTKLLLIPGVIFLMAMNSCEDQHQQTTTVSKSLFGGETIVSSSDSHGTFTRTEYGRDLFGNRTISSSRGHSNATEQEDLLVVVFKVVVALLAESAQ